MGAKGKGTRVWLVEAFSTNWGGGAFAHLIATANLNTPALRLKRAAQQRQAMHRAAATGVLPK